MKKERRLMDPFEQPDLVKLGSYLPRAFTIEMHHPAIVRLGDPTGNQLVIPKDAFPTFMHEIAHLVQDWSTFRGIIDFLNLWDQVAAISAYVTASPAEVPFPIVEPRGKNYRLHPDHEYAIELDMLRAMTEPRREWTRGKSWKFASYDVGAFAFPLAKKKVEGRAVNVTLVEETTGETYTHRLGAWEIKEAYSVAVGILHGGKPKTPTSAGFEYMVVDRILAHYFDDVTPLQCIALCQWALQDLAPANTLFALIETFETGGRKLPPAEDIYDAARQEAIARGFTQNAQDIVQMLRDKAMDYHAQGNEVMEALFRWYHDHAGRLLLTHLDPKLRFPLDTFLCEDSTGLTEDECNRRITGFSNIVHIPLLIWHNGWAYQITTDNRTSQAVFFNRCIVHLFGKIWRGSRESWRCPIYESCNLEMKDADDCLNRPWKKGWRFPTCAYGSAAKLFGIEDGKTFRLAPFAPP